MSSLESQKIGEGCLEVGLGSCHSSPCSMWDSESSEAMPMFASTRSQRWNHANLKLSDWSVEQVASWAAMTALPFEVASLLRESAINGQVLESLSEADLERVGICKFGWQRQLLLSRQELLASLARMRKEDVREERRASRTSREEKEGIEAFKISSLDSLTSANVPEDSDSGSESDGGEEGPTPRASLRSAGRDAKAGGRPGIPGLALSKIPPPAGMASAPQSHRCSMGTADAPGSEGRAGNKARAGSESIATCAWSSEASDLGQQAFAGAPAQPQRRRPSKLATLSVEEVASWAAMTSLPLEVAALLRENEVNGQVLESLSDEDFASIGVDKFGWRRQLVLLCRELSQQLEEEQGAEREGAEVMEIRDPVALSDEELERQDTPTGLSPMAAFDRAPKEFMVAGAGAKLGRPPSSSASVTTESTVESRTRQMLIKELVKEMSAYMKDEARDLKAMDPHSVDSATVSSVDKSGLQSTEGPGSRRSSLSDSRGKAPVPLGGVVLGTPRGADRAKVGERIVTQLGSGMTLVQPAAHNAVSATPATPRTATRIIHSASPVVSNVVWTPGAPMMATHVLPPMQKGTSVRTLPGGVPPVPFGAAASPAGVPPVPFGGAVVQDAVPASSPLMQLRSMPPSGAATWWVGPPGFGQPGAASVPYVPGALPPTPRQTLASPLPPAGAVPVTARPSRSAI